MKRRGSAAPAGAYTLEDIPGRPGWKRVRLYENAQEYSETRDGQTETGWEYDEYSADVPDWEGLAGDVEANYARFLERAKLEERDLSAEALYARAEELAQENTLLKAQVEAQTEQIEFYEDCIAEMAETVYA